MIEPNENSASSGLKIVGVQSAGDAADAALRAQYEVFPYPPRQIRSKF